VTPCERGHELASSKRSAGAAQYRQTLGTTTLWRVRSIIVTRTLWERRPDVCFFRKRRDGAVRLSRAHKKTACGQKEESSVRCFRANPQTAEGA
jgi:hypothetical protein